MDGYSGLAGRRHLRASLADREQVIGVLETAFVHGLLAKDEFDARVRRARASRTYADLAAAADLSTGLRRAARPLTRAESSAAWGLCGLIVTAVLTVVVVPAGTTASVVLVTAAVIYAVFWLLAGFVLLAWHHAAVATRLPSPRR